MEKTKKNSEEVIHGDNFVMYNDVIIPETPEQRFTNTGFETVKENRNTSNSNEDSDN